MMNTINKESILTVSQLTAAIKDILETEYRFVKICGEISNLKTPFSGHSYFTLKDSGAQIRAVLFKQQKRFVELNVQDGQQVVVFGRISLYEPRGEYQIVADSIELYGIGKLLKEFEQLKRKLADKGYFAVEFKKPLPPYPGKIIIISSPTGAAIQDFLKIVKNRMSPVHIQILPVKVQGKTAAAEIAKAIGIAQKIADADVIVLCRGGGSIEDLWAFNE
ncbi:MAG: exodeoxyribonuclease VII large subunit, partial [Proteobacteria bacterium]|nr:exodeoxyribonuclease VII large subunit [Pseudomonadota bacterium]